MPGTVEDYIAGLPADVQKTFNRVLDAIRKAAPDAEEVIKYGIPSFVLSGSLVHVGAFQYHIGFCPTPSGVAAFADELSRSELSARSPRRSGVRGC